MADEIRADYQQLQQVATQFSKQATAINQMRAQVKRSMNALHGNWIGKGSESFFSEMNDKVMPGTERLYKALQEASKITKQIAQTMKQAEDDAAAPFKTDIA
jgi:WXG100 family type VII secretion target